MSENHSPLPPTHIQVTRGGISETNGKYCPVLYRHRPGYPSDLAFIFQRLRFIYGGGNWSASRSGH